MNRAEFEHAIRAAAFHAKDDIVVIGSQAILASHPEPPESLVRSMELDVFPLNHPERSDAIDGAMGDGSPFHAAWDFYAQGVGRETLVAPAGWENRLIRLELPAIRRKEGTIVAWCLSAEDLVLAKLAAGRPHDVAFAEDALREEIVSAEQLRLGVELLPETHREDTRIRLEGLLARVSRRQPRPES